MPSSRKARHLSRHRRKLRTGSNYSLTGLISLQSQPNDRLARVTSSETEIEEESRNKQGVNNHKGKPAVAWLERAETRVSANEVGCRSRFDPLRSDPRFSVL